MSEATESFVTGAMRPLRPKLVPFAVVVVLILIPDYSLELAVRGQYSGGILRYVVSAESWFPSWLDADLQVTLAVIAIARCWEKDPWSSLVIERVINFTDNRLLAGLASVLVSLAVHLPGRDLGTMLQVTPIILLTTMLYIWRRNILPAFIAHFAGNAVTTLIIIR
jgi:hypothetical protein